MKWRKWNNIIHRDLGYLMVGLTIVYAVSGFMLNHKNDWNPNYTVVSENRTFTPVPENITIDKDAIAKILTEIGEPLEYIGTFRPDPRHLEVYYDGRAVTFDLTAGTAAIEKIRGRKVIKEMNALHLNVPGSVWTYVADFYALALLLLAITGLFVLKGKNGFSGRGKWFAIAGVIIPIVLAIIYAV